jgi:hypothetical protein
MSNQQLIIYQSQTDFIQNIIKKQQNDLFVKTTDDGLYYKHIYKLTPRGNMQIPTNKNPYYKQYTHWLNQSYIYQLINPPLFYSD